MNQENKWELNFVDNPYFYCRRLVVCISGFSFKEVTEVTGQAERWKTNMFKNAFRAFGLNCDERFKKFDPATVHPCILRSISSRPDEQNGWYASVYYDGIVYTPGHGFCDLEEHARQWPHLRHTSMLQVWI